MIHTVEMFGATCDGCNEGWVDEHHGYSAWNDKNAVAESIDDAGWHKTDDGKTYCPKCHRFDDDDNLILTIANP